MKSGDNKFTVSTSPNFRCAQKVLFEVGEFQSTIEPVTYYELGSSCGAEE